MPQYQDIHQIEYLSKGKEKILADMREMIAAAKEFNAIKAEFNLGGLKTYVDAQERKVKVEKESAQATNNLTKSVLDNEKATQARIKTEQAEERLKQQKIKTLKLEEEQLKKNAAAANIPFTHNLRPDGTVIEPKQGVTTGVIPISPQDKREVEALAGLQIKGTLTNEEYKNSFKGLLPVMGAATKSTEQLRLEEEREVKIRIEEKLLLQQETAALKNLVREENASITSTERKRAELIRLTAQYDKLTIAEKLSERGVALQGQVHGLTTEVKALEGATGRTARNVGNYTEDINKATISTNSFGKSISKSYGFLRTLANILPGIGISGLFLIAYDAIVNVIDGMDLFGKKASEASEQMKKLKDDSKEFGESLNQVQKGAIETGLKLQTFVDIARDGKVPLEERNAALVEANKLLGEHGEKLTIANINTRAVTEEVKKFTDALIAEALAAKYADQIANLYATRADALDRYNARLEEQKTLETEVKGAQGNNSRDLIDQYNDLINKRKEVNEQSDQYNFLTKEITKLTTRLNEEQKKSLGLFTDLGHKTKVLKENTKDYSDVMNDLNKELFVLGESLAAQIISEDAFDTDKIKAYEKAIKSLFDLGFTNDSPLVEQLLGKLDPLKLERDLKIAIKSLKSAVKQDEELSFPVGITIDKPTEEKAYADALEAQQSFLNIENSEAQLALLKRFNAGKISRKRYESELLDIQEQFAEKSLQNQIDSLKKERDFAFAGVEQTEEVNKKKLAINEKIAALELQLQEKITNKIKKGYDRRLEDLQRFIRTVQQSISEISELIDNIYSIGITKQKNDLQEVEDLRQQNYENEVERITNSTLAATDKETQLGILERKRQAEKQEFERKNREEELKRARFTKATTIAQIALEGAAAVVHQFTSGDVYTALARGIAVGALSAAKLAIAIATPIPKYAHGLQGNKGDHFGIYGEAGAELIEKPGYRPFIATKATVDFLPKGTNITPLKKDEINGIMLEAMARQTAHALYQKQPDKPNQVELATLGILKKIYGKRTVVNNKIMIDPHANNKNAYFRRS